MKESPRYAELLTEARRSLGVPEASTIAEVVELLEAWGAMPMAVGEFDANLFDEYVDEALVAYQGGLTDAALIAEHLTRDERVGFLNEDHDSNSDDEAGDDGRLDEGGWSAISDEIDSARRVIVILERDRDAPDAVGNFRVHGAGQWVREALWAATGVLPRDPGSEGSALYSRAFEMLRPERPDLPVAAYEKLPGWLWTGYVMVMRPRWRRARARSIDMQPGP